MKKITCLAAVLCATALFTPLSQDRRLVLKSGADLRRDFVWMGDVAKAVLDWVTGRERAMGQTLNVAYGKSLSLRAPFTWYIPQSTMALN